MELTAEVLVFLVFAVITLGGGLGVVMARNLFRAALLLLLSLFGIAGMFVLLAAPFLAAAQVLVYMGGIAILILFAVMLTRGVTAGRETMNSQWPLAVLVAVLMFGALLWTADQVGTSGGPGFREPVADVTRDTTVDLGRSLTSFEKDESYVLPFELASFLLAAALVGAIYIARDREAD